MKHKEPRVTSEEKNTILLDAMTAQQTKKNTSKLEDIGIFKMKHTKEKKG